MLRLAKLAVIVPIGVTFAITATAILIPLRIIANTMKKKEKNERPS